MVEESMMLKTYTIEPGQKLAEVQLYEIENGSKIIDKNCQI